MKTATFLRAESVIFQLPDGRVFAISPPSRARFRDAIVVDLDPGEDHSPSVRAKRLAAQLAALAGRHIEEVRESGTAAEIESAGILRGLTPAQEEQILAELCRRGLCATAPAAKPGKARKGTSAVGERVRGFDEDSVALATHLHRTRREVEAIEYVESLELLTAIYAERNAARRFEAALHGVKLS